MTVDELRQALEGVDGDLRVYVETGEGMLDIRSAEVDANDAWTAFVIE